MERALVRMSVDGERCMGHGRCYRLMPDVLGSDEEGYVTIRGQEIEVPEGQQENAVEAEGSCPEEAISLSGE